MDWRKTPVVLPFWSSAKFFLMLFITFMLWRRKICLLPCIMVHLAFLFRREDFLLSCMVRIAFLRPSLCWMTFRSFPDESVGKLKVTLVNMPTFFELVFFFLIDYLSQRLRLRLRLLLRLGSPISTQAPILTQTLTSLSFALKSDSDPRLRLWHWLGHWPPTSPPTSIQTPTPTPTLTLTPSTLEASTPDSTGKVHVIPWSCTWPPHVYARNDLDDL